MKKTLSLLLLLICGITYAQTDTSYWDKGGTLGLNGSQSSFTNWSQGGENQISITGSVRLFAKYLKGKNSWDNLFIGDLGYSKQGSQDNYRKAEDKFELNSKYGRKANDKWFYSALLNFKSQFTAGYEYTDTSRTLISDFMAPGYIKSGLGMDYKPNKDLSLFLSPATARWTIVTNQRLIDEGRFGFPPTERNEAGTVISGSGKVRTEFGALLRLSYTKEIWTNVNFASILELYSDYLANPQNIDVDWQFAFTFKVNKFLNAQLKGHMIYDDDVNIYYDSNDDGINDSYGPIAQFKESFSLGLVYNL